QSEFKRLPHDPLKCLKYCFMLHSQYRPCLIHKEDGKDIFLATPYDIEALEKCPVHLASTLSYPETMASFSTNRAYPPEEHGTIGIITSTEEWRYYTISMLPIEAQERQKQISQKLEELSALPTPSMTLVFEEEEVRSMIQQLAQDYYQHHTLARIPAPRNMFI